VPLPFASPARGAAGNVVLNVSGAFPFSDDVTITLQNAVPGSPLRIRIPGWAAAATYTVNGGPEQRPPAAGAMLKLAAGSDGSLTVVLSTNPAIAVEHGYNNAVSVYRGPLMYALPIKESVRVLNQYYMNSTDMAFQNASAWQFALVVDADAPGGAMRFESNGTVPGKQPWAPETMPLALTATIRSLPSWGLQLNSTAPPPTSPLSCSAGESGQGLRGGSVYCGVAETVQLRPYASTNLRIGALPWTPPS